LSQFLSLMHHTAPLLLYPFPDLNTGSGSYELAGSSSLKLANDASTLYCFDPRTICFGINPLLPAVDPDIGWPIPFIYWEQEVERFIFLAYV
jgi:hypothetical protein